MKRLAFTALTTLALFAFAGSSFAASFNETPSTTRGIGTSHDTRMDKSPPPMQPQYTEPATASPQSTPTDKATSTQKTKKPTSHKKKSPKGTEGGSTSGS